MKPQRFTKGQLVVCAPMELEYRNVDTGQVHSQCPPGVAEKGKVYTVEAYDHWSFFEQEWFITLAELPDSVYSNAEGDFQPLVSTEHLEMELSEISSPLEIELI